VRYRKQQRISQGMKCIKNIVHRWYVLAEREGEEEKKTACKHIQSNMYTYTLLQ
jgi:hypothetical protein